MLVDGEERARLGKGDFFGEMSHPARRAPPWPTSSRHARLHVCTSAVRSSRASCSTTRGDVPDAPDGEPAPRHREPPGLGRTVPDPGDDRRRGRRVGATLPAGRLRRRRRRQRAGRPPDELLPDPLRHRPRGHLRRPVARRDVPALPVLPAAAVMDQAVRARWRTTRASTSGTTGTASSRSSPRTAR